MSLRWQHLFDIPGLPGRPVQASDNVPRAYRPEIAELCEYILTECKRAEDGGWLFMPAVRPGEAVEAPAGADPETGEKRTTLVAGDVWDLALFYIAPPHHKPRLRPLMNPRDTYSTPRVLPGHAATDTAVNAKKLPPQYRFSPREIVEEIRRLCLWADDTGRPWVATHRAANPQEISGVVAAYRRLVPDEHWDASWRMASLLDSGSRVVVVRIGAPQRALADVGLTVVRCA